MIITDYWETLYRNGGVSGSGSVGLSRLFKWRTVNKHVNVKKSSVIDVGCGDLTFWKRKTCADYTGIEMSTTRYNLNKELRPDFKFINSNAAKYQNIKKADVVFCFDMLFHIMDDEDYKTILENLTKYSNEYIFVYTWYRNPFDGKTDDGEYQKYRNFDDYVNTFLKRGFILKGVKKAPKCINPFGAMWIFKKVQQGL